MQMGFQFPDIWICWIEACQLKAKNTSVMQQVYPLSELKQKLWWGFLFACLFLNSRIVLVILSNGSVAASWFGIIIQFNSRFVPLIVKHIST